MTSGTVDIPTASAPSTRNEMCIRDRIFALADELTPGIGTYGFVYNEGEVNSQSIIEKAKAFLAARGLAYEEVTVDVYKRQSPFRSNA